MPKGQYTYDIFKRQQIDLICVGNHELYKVNSSNDEFYHTVPNFKDNYLASNLDIYNPETGKLEALAPRYKKFKTKNQGIRILAFGFIFDFTGNANNTVVHTVKETTEQDWFKEAIRDRDVDLVLVYGHVAIRSAEYDLLFKTIRSVQWDTPIAIFGGHTHIRDYKKYDSKSWALESGRYMETIGFMSIEGLSSGKKDVMDAAKKGPAFARRYIDNNLFSLHYHSGTNESTFQTERGRNTSEMITSARHELKLDSVRGCSPQDYFLNRAPYPDKSSLLSLLEERILPEYLSSAQRAYTTEPKPALVLTNTGAIRFDIFKGAYTHDTEYLVCPFTSGIRYVGDVPYEKAKRLLKMLNNDGPILDDIALQTGLAKWMLVPPEQAGGRKEKPLSSQSRPPTFYNPAMHGGQVVLDAADEDKPLPPGYTTEDDAGTDGDDTLHSEIAFYNVPNCIQSLLNVKDGEEPDKVDVAYNEFIEPWVLLALRYLGHEVKQEDTGAFVHKTMTDIITGWVEQNWKPQPPNGQCVGI